MNEKHYNLLIKKSKSSIDKGVPNFSKQNIKNKGVWKVIEITRKDEFVNEEEIASANKKYKAILKYCLNDDHNKPIYHEKFSVITKIKLG